MKLAFIFNNRKLFGLLTRFWTGCYAYHTVWHDGTHMWDMNLIRRKRAWPYYPADQVIEFDVPEVSSDYLNAMLEHDDSTYGWKDYLLFAIRPLCHLFGMSTINAGGVICSEMINIDMRANGVKTPWKLDDEPPSPCMLYVWMKGRV